MCSAANAPLARIVQAGLVKVNRPDEEVQAAMDEAALRELPKVSARTAYLALLANLAMLSGLLGTVTGLIKSFGAVAGGSIDPSQKATILAEGNKSLSCASLSPQVSERTQIWFCPSGSVSCPGRSGWNGATHAQPAPVRS